MSLALTRPLIKSFPEQHFSPYRIPMDRNSSDIPQPANPSQANYPVRTSSSPEQTSVGESQQAPQFQQVSGPEANSFSHSATSSPDDYQRPAQTTPTFQTTDYMANRNYPEPASRYPPNTTSGPGGQNVPAAYSHPQHHHQLPAYPQHEIPHGYAQHPAGSQPQVWRGDWTQGYSGHPGQYGHPNGQVSNASNPPPIPVARTLEKVYSFVPIPGAQQHKRPRRRYEEIERMYKCGWNGCEKAYGTLNHLNAHVTMQSHGQKRTPEEFKEIRKEWKARKKEEEAQKKAAAERERERLAAEQATQSSQLLDHQQGQAQQSQAPQQSIQATAQRGMPSSQAYGAPRQLPPISNYGSPATSAVHYASPTAAPIEQMQQFNGGMYGNYPQAAYNQQSIYTGPGQPTTVAVAANSRMVPAGATNGDEQDGVTEGENEVVNNSYAS